MEHLTTYGFMSSDESEGKVYLDADFFILIDWVSQLNILQDWANAIESIRKTVHDANYGEGE